ncbi:MAG: hypothetical protein GOMPHAMPRED_005280 [Gomphillus americanus]|uniref:Uncharacterized protein n=1 Tax=Gomphillus americanus TaxID=1940652 RepID=A0A8H3FTV2_9LECA|nr:MAG: hypothetical protein GOMPHAMPRED_005280 [Gomphillus americanus]
MQVSSLLILSLSTAVAIASPSSDVYNSEHAASVYIRSPLKDEDLLSILTQRAYQPRTKSAKVVHGSLDPEATRQVLELTLANQNKKAQSSGIKAFASAFKLARAKQRLDKTFESRRQAFLNGDPEPHKRLASQIHWQALLERYHFLEKKRSWSEAIDKGRPAKDVVKQLRVVGVRLI